ncbi:MAG: RusA family crossover junction endodeoxyribonuclease [Lachnospiraceae bacterium]|nr:RusA family crossover junction endodeoxyribonuclease [Lachnospiraceae bacterium]
MIVKFTVPGQPVGKARPRVTKAGHAYTPKKTVDYENLVRAEYHRQCGDYKFPDDAMLDMRIMAFYRIPKSAPKRRKSAMERGEIRPTVKPDSDNVIKGIADSGNGIFYRDDTQIVDCQIRKFYSYEPRVVVTIQEAAHYQSSNKQEE